MSEKANGLSPALPQQAGLWRSLGRRAACRLRGDEYHALYEKRPTTLSIEPTNRCNLNCPYCLCGQQVRKGESHHNLMSRGYGFMEFSLYEKIVADAVAFGIREMQLLFMGEPLLHNRIVDMVGLAARAGMSTHIFTNGQLLTEPLLAGLAAAGLTELRFSVDGATEETYRKNRVGGSFARVVDNMRTAAAHVRATGTPLRLVWQFIALSNNEHEIDAARQAADGMGLEFMVKSYAVTNPDLAPRDPALRRELQRKPCTDIYRVVFSYWNGDVVICCYDQLGEHVLGNLREQSLETIWFGEKAVELKRRIGRAGRLPAAEPSMCRSCLKWSHHAWQTSDGKTVYGGE